MNIRRWGITVVACVAVFAALALFKVMEIRAAIAYGESFPEHSETVEEAVVETTEFTPSIKVIGEVVAAKRLDLRNELAGEITAVNFASGDHVEAGQILLQLDVSIEQANLAAAEARTTLAESTFERARNLYRTNAVSKEQLDKAQSDLATAQAEVKVLQRTIAKKTLRAPFAGTAGLHQFEVGQYLTDNTLITTLIGDSEVTWVDFKVPQFYRPLERGAEISIETIGSDNNRVKTTGHVIAENTLVHAENRSRSYRAAVKTDNRVFTANAMVSVEVPIADETELLKVPAVSIQHDALGSYVFVLQKEEQGDGFRALRKQVTIKTTIGDTTLINPQGKQRALKAGDRIAADGAFKLQEGMLVYSRERQAKSQGMAAEMGSGASDQEAL